MNNLSQLQSEYCHLEYLRKEEGDEKRHKTRCSHYCANNYCTVWSGKCRGSAHCEFYKEKGDEKINENNFKSSTIKKKIIALNREERKLKEKLRKKGTLIWDAKFEDVGEVVRFNEEKIIINFDNVGEKTFVINFLIKSDNWKTGKSYIIS